MRACHESDEFHLTLTTSSAWDLSSAGRASALQAEGHRFEPCRSHLTNFFISYADVAQLAEQLICNQQVIGSSPIIGFIQFNIELYYGQIPEWPKGTDCKSAATCFDGSNPSLPITLYRVTNTIAGWSSLEARRAHNPEVIGSNPIPATRCVSIVPS